MKVDLVDFVRRALEKGISRPEIEAALAEAGWQKNQIARALSSFADTSFPVPLPMPRSSLTARDAFLYLVLFSTLYCVVWHVTMLLFLFVDRAFPDKIPVSPVFDFQASLRWHISVLLVCLPVFVFTFAKAGKRIARDPQARDSGPRKWLTYITLFMAVMIIAVDLAYLVYTMLAGDLTTRFGLKVLIILALAGGVSGYIYADVSKDERE